MEHNLGTWRSLGYQPRDGESPRLVEWSYGRRRGTHHIYTAAQVEKRPTRRPITPAAVEATTENILAAIVCVNWAAKRRRDAACSCYESGAFGLATYHREQKEILYISKDRGIWELIQRGELTAKEKHGSVFLYIGGGRSFHSTIRPDFEVPETRGEVLIEAKTARGSMRIVDAKSLLTSLPAVPPERKVAPPRREPTRLYRMRDDYDAWDDGYELEEGR